MLSYVLICGGAAAGMTYIILAYIVICNWINSTRQEKKAVNQDKINISRESIE